MKPTLLEPTVIDVAAPESDVGGRRLVVRARISTWSPPGTHRRAIRWTHVRPIAVDVTEADGSTARLDILGGTTEALQGIAVAGVAVASTAAGIVLLLGWLTRPGSPSRRKHKEVAE